MEEIAIGTPIVDNKGQIPSMPYEYAVNLFKLIASGIVCVDWVTLPGETMTDSMNRIVDRFLEQNTTAKKFLMLHPDTLLRPNDLALLLATEADIVAPISVKSSPPFNISAFRFDEKNKPFPLVLGQDFERDMVIDVDVVDLNCVVIRREVLEKMATKDHPFFEIRYEGKVPIPDYFNFCLKAKKLGFKIMMNAHAQVESIGWAKYFLEDE